MQYSTFVRAWYSDGSHAVFKSSGITPIVLAPTTTNLVGRAVSHWFKSLINDSSLDIRRHTNCPCAHSNKSCLLVER